MSPDLKDYYREKLQEKLRRNAFYIVENELNNKENPPEVSAIIGLDKELEVAFYAARRPPLEKPAMKLGIRINRVTNKIIKKEKEDEKDKHIDKKKVIKRNEIHCPSMPTQWKNNFDIIIPKAEFAY